MITAVCRSGPLDGKLISMPDHAYSFICMNFFNSCVYELYTFCDRETVEWRLKKPEIEKNYH